MRMKTQCCLLDQMHLKRYTRLILKTWGGGQKKIESQHKRQLSIFELKP